MGQGDSDEVRVWRCRCAGLDFFTYEDRHAHECPPTKDELVLTAADKLVELVEKLLEDSDLHDNPTNYKFLIEPSIAAIQEYKTLRDGKSKFNPFSDDPKKYNPFCDDPECDACNGLGADGHIY